MLSDLLEEDIAVLLQDCGCSDEKTACFLKCMEQEKSAEGTTLLIAHRTELLHQVHIREKQISCLDYLLYKMKGSEEEQKLWKK